MSGKAPIVRDEKAGTYYWCACGKTGNEPFCDGSHSRLHTGKTPKEVTLESDRKVAWCTCKQSSTAPFCDGTHARL